MCLWGEDLLLMAIVSHPTERAIATPNAGGGARARRSGMFRLPDNLLAAVARNGAQGARRHTVLSSFSRSDKSVITQCERGGVWASLLCVIGCDVSPMCN